METPADALREQIRKITEANRLLNEDGKKILSDEAAAKARDAAIKKYRKEIEKTTEKAKELKREIGINEGFEAFSKEALNLNKRIVTKQDLPKKDRPAIDAKAVGAAIQQAIADGEKEAADAMLKAQQQNGETQKQIAELTEKLRNEMSTRLGEIRDLIRDGGELPEDFMPRMNEIEKRLGIPQGNPQANANPGGFLHVPNVIDAIRKGEDQTEKQGNKQNQLSANTNRLLEEMNRRIADIELNIQVEEVQG